MNLGKCKNCNSKISISYLIVEILTSVLFVFSYLRFGFSFEFLAYIIFYSGFNYNFFYISKILFIYRYDYYSLINPWNNFYFF